MGCCGAEGVDFLLFEKKKKEKGVLLAAILHQGFKVPLSRGKITNLETQLGGISANS